MSFPLLVQAELLKLFSRPSAKIGLLASLAVGLALPLLAILLVNSGMVVNGVDARSAFSVDANDTLVNALYVRSFPVGIRAFLIILGAQAFAGELAARTLREDLLRPVPRWAVLMAKLVALALWDAASLGLGFFGGALVGIVAFGTEGAWVATALAYSLALLCDVGVIAIVLAIGVLTRSTVATIASLIVFFVLDKMLGWAMLFASTAAMMFTTSEPIIRLLNQWPALPSAAFGSWAFVLADNDWNWVSVSAAGLYTALALLFALLWFRRSEVP
ncbi:MAG: ABC transporter permease [Alphaproteobacteria bacterium]|nr:ABC transporter permease [Alphaproteobacteria bacterium]